MIEYRIDLFALFIFLGIVQAIFLCFFFFSSENRKINASVFQGLMLLSMALCNVEILLMYTGYIQHCWWLVDFSEPIAFLIGPSFYLMVLSLIRGEIKKSNYWHFAFAIIYTILVIPYFVQSNEVKYNSWVWSYHPELPFKPYDFEGDPRWFWVTNHHTLLVLFSLAFYAVLSLIEVIKAFKNRRESFFKTSHPVLKKIRTGMIQWISATILVIAIKAFFQSDTGDHLFAAYISLITYLTSFRVLSQSGFFKQTSLNENKSRATAPVSATSKALLNKLTGLMEQEKVYLQPGISLPELAQRLGTTVHTLSQAINDGLGKNFFEMVAQYRVAEAKRLLVEQKNIKIEEIAEQVGYNSKSSFNIVFKKVTGKTPSEYRAQPE